MNSIDSFFTKKQTPYDIKSMTEILQASYSTEVNKDEIVEKRGFAPSSLGYSSGQCPRKWNLLFNGAHFVETYDATSVDNMQNGTDRHTRIQNNLLLSGLDIELEKEIWNEDPPMHCFVDAVVKDFNGYDIVIEIKTTRFEAFTHRKVNNRGPDYQELQLLIYLYLLDLQYGILLYENKNSHEKLLVPVELAGDNLKKVEYAFDWMRRVYKSYQDGQLPEIPYRSNSKICKSCPIKDFCFEQPAGDIKIEPLNYSEVIDAVDW